MRFYRFVGTASSVVTLLKRSGTESRVYVYSPNRNAHGYGLSLVALDEIANNESCLMACEFGSSQDFLEYLKTSYKNILQKHDNLKPLLVSIGLVVVEESILQKYSKFFENIIITDNHTPTKTRAYQYNPEKAGIHSYSSSLVAYHFFKEMLGLEDCEDALELASVGLLSSYIPLDDCNRPYYKRVLNPKHMAIKQLIGTDKNTWENLNYQYSFHFINVINSSGRLSGLKLDKKEYNHTQYYALYYCLNPKCEASLSILNDYNRKRLEFNRKLLADLRATEYADGLVVAGNAALPLGFLGLLAYRLLDRHKANVALVYQVTDDDCFTISCRARFFDLQTFLSDQQANGLDIEFRGHTRASDLQSDRKTFESLLNALQCALTRDPLKTQVLPSKNNIAISNFSKTTTFKKEIETIASVDPNDRSVKGLRVYLDQYVNGQEKAKKCFAWLLLTTTNTLWAMRMLCPRQTHC
ncbi:hypothetical protein [Helicobacter bizzozeronii]|uniref:hypothetical protein n=1 Tax=Helicobacter bizzozeronii TaxID=56877 RepID=UPI0013152A21|nr:hypothetical protein [Helicobacter bizzozeronii]